MAEEGFPNPRLTGAAESAGGQWRTPHSMAVGEIVDSPHLPPPNSVESAEKPLRTTVQTTILLLGMVECNRAF